MDPIEFIASLILVLILGPFIGGVCGVILADVLAYWFGWFHFFSRASETTWWDTGFLFVSAFVGTIMLLDKLQDPVKHIRSNIEAFLLHDWRRSRSEKRERTHSSSVGS